MKKKMLLFIIGILYGIGTPSSGICEEFIYYPYTFKYTYGNNDKYTGTVYAGEDKGYSTGNTWTKVDENGQTGTYEITDRLPGSAAYFDKLGEVYVDNYFDAESNKNFTPLHKGQDVANKSYLENEIDYIGVNGANDYKFGQGYYEADVGDKYIFRYYYDKNNLANCDWYEGEVYRAPAVGLLRRPDNRQGERNRQDRLFRIPLHELHWRNNQVWPSLCE